MFKKYSVYIFLAIITLIPTILWLSVQTSIPGNLASMVAGLGELSGIVGTVLFSLVLMLSTRPIFLEKYFSELNGLYDYHSKIGQVAFMLLLVHPLMLLPRYVYNMQDAVKFFSISNNWQQSFGILALYLTIVVIILTLYLRPKYNIWKFIHKFLGVALFLGALHVYLSPSFVLHSSWILNVYILGWMFVGVMLWLYRSIFGKSLNHIYKYTISNIRALNDSITEVSFTPANVRDRIKFRPGQFVFLKIVNSSLSKEQHPFSIVSLPGEDILTLAIKSLGDYTAKLNSSIHIWDTVFIEGPFGSLSCLDGKRKRQVWIAGGVGITPFVSMAKDLKNNRGLNVHMYYAVRNESEAVYADILKEIESRIDSFTLTIFYSDKRGFITAKYIYEQVQDIGDRDILIVAPPAMVHSIKGGLEELGIQDNHIYTEEFNF